MKSKRLFCLIAAMILLAFLSENCRSAGDASETAIASAGIVNPDQPQRGEWDLAAKKVWEISNFKGNPLAAPMITVSDDEIVYVFDQKQSSNVALDRDGEIIAMFGPRGQGPGEITNEVFFFPVDDKLVIFGYPNRLHFFQKNGEFIRTENIDYQDMPYAFLNENEYVSAPPPGIGDSKIKYINLKTDVKKVLAEITYKAPVIRGERDVIVVMPGLTGLMKLGLDQKSQRIYYGINDEYRIDMIDFQGNASGSFSVQRKKRIISRETKTEMVRMRQGGMPAEVINESIKQLPSEITCFHKIQIEDGLICVFQDNAGANWDDQQIDLFSLDGKYLYRSVFRPGEGKTIYNSSNYADIMFIKKGCLYLSLEDKKGEISVAKFAISLPVNPKPNIFRLTTKTGTPFRQDFGLWSPLGRN